MTCGAEDGGQGVNIMNNVGLVGSHAYSLISAHIITEANGKETRLVKLRNPWGEKEWTGDWSDNSNRWTPELKEQLSVENKDDGIFFMQYEDFIKYFSDV